MTDSLNLKNGIGQYPVLPNDTLLVGFDFTHGEDNYILIVGKREGHGNKEYLQIINAFQGEDAKALYEMLTTVNKKVEVKIQD